MSGVKFANVFCRNGNILFKINPIKQSNFALKSSKIIRRSFCTTPNSEKVKEEITANDHITSNWNRSWVFSPNLQFSERIRNPYRWIAYFLALSAGITICYKQFVEYQDTIEEGSPKKEKKKLKNALRSKHYSGLSRGYLRNPQIIDSLISYVENSQKLPEDNEVYKQISELIHNDPKIKATMGLSTFSTAVLMLFSMCAYDDVAREIITQKLNLKKLIENFKLNYEYQIVQNSKNAVAFTDTIVLIKLLTMFTYDKSSIHEIVESGTFDFLMESYVKSPPQLKSLFIFPLLNITSEQEGKLKAMQNFPFLMSVELMKEAAHDPLIKGSVTAVEENIKNSEVHNYISLKEQNQAIVLASMTAAAPILGFFWGAIRNAVGFGYRFKEIGSSWKLYRRLVFNGALQSAKGATLFVGINALIQSLFLSKELRKKIDTNNLTFTLKQCGEVTIAVSTLFLASAAYPFIVAPSLVAGWIFLKNSLIRHDHLVLHTNTISPNIIGDSDNNSNK